MREISTEGIKLGEHIVIDGKEYVARKGKHDECKGCAFEYEKCEYIPCGEYILKNVNEIEKPHGRLIEAEEVKKLLQSGLSLDTYEDQAYVCSLIDEIPTIIEASTSPAGFCNTEGCSNSKPDMSKAQNHICPYYKGVCSLDENILCYCHTHYEMCDKFIEAST